MVGGRQREGWGWVGTVGDEGANEASSVDVGVRVDVDGCGT